tara:strand:+ start:2962 stop:3360 length:399 start_codon:yes stop_codon:yes gene_type:complete
MKLTNAQLKQLIKEELQKEGLAGQIAKSFPPTAAQRKGGGSLKSHVATQVKNAQAGIKGALYILETQRDRYNASMGGGAQAVQQAKLLHQAMELLNQFMAIDITDPEAEAKNPTSTKRGIAGVRAGAARWDD